LESLTNYLEKQVDGGIRGEKYFLTFFAAPGEISLASLISPESGTKKAAR